MQSLADLALRLDAAQVVCRIQGGATGRAWGAWPIRAESGRGVLAAAGVDAGFGLTTWERLALELTAAWSQDGAAEPEPIPSVGGPWHTPAEFRVRLELSTARHGQDGRAFAVHRMRADVAAPVLDSFARELASDLRGGDAMCRVGPDTLLVLTSGPAFARVLDRIAARWERARAQDSTPRPTLNCERIELTSRDDRELFLAVAGGWLGVD
jgi:hypothetical protein